MSRIKRLIRPESQTLGQALNWKAAIPVLGLAAMCTAVLAHAAPDAKPVEPDTMALADFKSCQRPVYPAESLAQKHTGTVTLGFLVDTNGKVKETRVAKSSGHLALDDSARTALEKCSFKPAQLQGKPVESWTKVQYVWSLQ